MVIAVVAQVARRTLSPTDSVAFFRGLGRAHGLVGTVALVIALGTGGVLLRDHNWDGRLIAAVVLTVALLAVSVVGMAQARRMTVLRRAAVEDAGDVALRTRVERGAQAALVLRGLIALLTLALVVVGACLAT